jgi:hypothetical protein
VWRKERVRRTSTTVEAVGEDLTTLDEAVVGEDSMAVNEAVDDRGGVEVDAVGEAWRRMQSVVGEVWRRTR